MTEAFYLLLIGINLAFMYNTPHDWPSAAAILFLAWVAMKVTSL